MRQFLEQYFLVYDTESRQPLVNAYHPCALFSMTMAHAHGQYKKNNWLDWYATDSRNLLRVSDLDRRQNLLQQGQVSIVSFLQELPTTKHDVHGFTVDLTLFTVS